MNWLERYVEAVKRYLPKRNRDDLGEEILSALTDKLDAKEAELGRKMNPDEVKAWIAGQDHPMVLAAGYQEHREVVPSELFLPYLFALKIAFVIVFALKVFGTGVYILGHEEFEFSYISKHLLGGLIESVLLAFASITLIFHFLGRRISAKKLFSRWKVDDLPEGPAKWTAVPWGATIFEIVASVFFLGIVNGYYLGRWDFPWADWMAVNPAFKALLPWVNTAVGIGIVHRLWLLFKPTWTISKLISRIVITGFSLWVLVMIMGIDPLLSYAPEYIVNHPGLGLDLWLDKVVSISLTIVGAFFIFDIIRDAYRIFRLQS